MKNRFLALFMATLFVISSIVLTNVSAAGTWREFFDNQNISLTREVQAEVLVKKDSATRYAKKANITAADAASLSEFDFKATAKMSSVKSDFNLILGVARDFIDTMSPSEQAALTDDLNNSLITGEFVITIQVPKNLTVDESYKLNGVGFDVAGTVFEETVPREYVEETNWNQYKVTMNVIGGTKVSDIEGDINNKLNDIVFTCENAQPTEFGVYDVIIEASGSVNIGGFADINFVFKPDVKKATIVATEKRLGDVVVDAGDPLPDVTIAFVFGDEVDVIPSITGKGSASVNLDTLAKPEKEGYLFGGFFSDKALTIPLSGNITTDTDMIIYGKWVNAEVPDAFESGIHKVYVLGYPDGLVRPEENISREEAITMFYRLMKHEEIDVEFTGPETKAYTDVAPDRWSAEAIYEMSGTGILKGYPDGSFKPAKNITRAEFAAIISRFVEDRQETGTVFADIAGHWAETEILTAAAHGWVIGYEDGSYKPEQFITRIEAIKIINRMLVRYATADGLLEGIRIFSDCPETDKYFLDIVEASNTHKYTRKEDGFSEQWVPAE